MNLPQQIAKHFRDVYLGGNWTTSNLKEVLKDVTWEEATTQVGTFNTMLTLTFHMSYYVMVMRDTLEGKPLNAKDAHSFDHPKVENDQDWENLTSQIWKDVEVCEGLIKNLPASVFEESFTDEKYGTYYRNIAGIVEHSHYHLGQIVMLKKWLIEKDN